MLNIKLLDRVSNEQIQQITRTQPLFNSVGPGHIVMMPEEEPCRRFALHVYQRATQGDHGDKGIILHAVTSEGYRKYLNPGAIASLVADHIYCL